jgi:hypothetical protein
MKRVRNPAAQFGAPRVLRLASGRRYPGTGGRGLRRGGACPRVRLRLTYLPNACAALVQKPVGKHLARARALGDLYRPTSLDAAVNFQLRFVPFVTAAHRLIAQRVVGELPDLEVWVTAYMLWYFQAFVEATPCVETFITAFITSKMITGNHGHELRSRHQKSNIKQEGPLDAILAIMVVLMSSRCGYNVWHLIPKVRDVKAAFRP